MNGAPDSLASTGPGPGALHVLADAHLVQFACGGSVALHPVHARGLPMLTQRALAVPQFAGLLQLQLIDLAKMVPALDAELRASPRRDVHGMVLYTLRQAYATRQAFCADAQRTALGNWWPFSDGTHRWQPAARQVDAQVAAAAVAADLYRLPQLGVAP
jgi:hypothetical protein